MKDLQFLELSSVANHLSLGSVCPKWACEQGDSALFPWKPGPQGHYLIHSLCIWVRDSAQTRHWSWRSTEAGVEETIFQTRHRRAKGLGGTTDTSFSFLLSHLSKGVHLERVLFRVMETVLQTHGDGWDRDEHGGMKRRAWDEGGSRSSLTSHSCLSLGKALQSLGVGTPSF